MTTTNKLQERIEQRANARFEQELRNLANLIGNNPIGRRLKIDGIAVENVNSDNVFFSGGRISKILSERSDIEKIKEELVGCYIKEETDKLLTNLELLGNYINQE